MAPVKQKAREHAHKKRNAGHHRHSKRYLKVYWPYAPMLLIVALGLFLGNWQPATRNGVLAYATEMGIDTLLVSTNEQRSANGSSTLKLNSKLTAAAQNKANDMTSRNYWSHATPDGKEPWVFVQKAGYEYQKAGENLAYGFDSSKDTITGWMNSEGHRKNLLDNGYTEVGFGFANARNYNDSGPETVVVAMYGRPTSATPLASSSTPTTNEGESFVAPHRTMGIARINTLTDGRLPWATFAIGLMSGLALAVVALRHGLALKRLALQGEEFFVHHPFLDIVLVTLVMTGYVLSQTSGVIR
jgi:hypothetical protein